MEKRYGTERKGKGLALVQLTMLLALYECLFDGHTIANFEPNSVVDEDLQVVGASGMYVCDMSVMPLSSSANPVRTLAALALRLSEHLSHRV